MAAPTLPGGKNIAGLPNAIVLFPRTAKVGPFEVIISTASEGTQYQALLTHMTPNRNLNQASRSVTLKSEVKDTMNAALCHLLHTTAILIEKRFSSVLENIDRYDTVELFNGAELNQTVK